MALITGSRSRQQIDDEGGPPSQRGGASSDDDRPGYIGVPKDYTVRGPRQQHPNYYPHGYSYSSRGFGAGAGPLDPIEIKPRYMDGDEWRPASWAPGDIADLQRAMAGAGLIGPTTRVRLGAWDETSRNAYKQLLGFANGSGVDVNTALRQYAEGITVGGPGAGSGLRFDENGNIIGETFTAPPLEVQLPNRADVEKVLRTAVIDKLGEGWSQAEIAKLADTYLWQKVMAPQTDAYQQQVENLEDEFHGRAPRNKVITNVDVMDPETFVEGELRRRDPAGFQATEIAEDYAPAFFAALEGYF
jgi:hypothetical protein